MNKTSRGLKKGTATRHKWEPKLVDTKNILQNTIYIYPNKCAQAGLGAQLQMFAGTKHGLSPDL